MILIKHISFIIFFSLVLHAPVKTIYTLHKYDHTTDKRRNFKYDNKIDKHWQNTKYKGNRGHLIPFEDLGLPTMIFTNVVDQNANFNQGLWKNIENYTRYLAKRFDSVQVITGAIYHNGSIPDSLYKIDIVGRDTLIFKCSNEPHTDKQPLHYLVKHL